MKKSLFVTGLVLFCAVSFARRHSGAPPPAPVVVPQAVALTEVYDALLYPARIVSKVQATVLSESDGVVQKIPKPLGSRVAAGETLLVLTNPDPVYTFAPFQVVSPVSGIVSAVDVTIGSRVAKGQRLGAVTDPSRVHAVIEVTAADLGALKVGMPGELELGDSHSHRGVTVAGISPFLDPATGTATAELKIDDKKRLPPPGILGRVKFRARVHQGIQLPDSAITYRGEGAIVRILDGEKVVFRAVKLGPARQGKFEVLEGLKAGETIVLRANTFIADGEKVTLQKETKEDS